ncbi:MAG: hypothetical protein ACUVSX_05325 [Aggregatilineales bacterium]
MARAQLSTSSRLHTWGAAAVAALAGLLRCAYLLQIEHNTDRAYPIWQALLTLERGALPLVGQQTSVLFANPALTGYLYLPAVALTRSPLGPVVFTIALNTLGVWFAFLAGRAVGGPRVGLIAAFLVSVNPWVIEYSRLTWVQGLLPFFAPALAWALWTALAGALSRPGRRLGLAWALLTLATQTYLLAFALVVPFAVSLALYARRVARDRRLRRVCAAGALAFAAATALYAAALLADSGQLGAELERFSAGGPRLSGEALSHALRLVTGADYPAARGVEAPADDAAVRQTLTQAAHLVLTACLAAGAALALARAARGDRRAALPLLWFALPAALMSYVSQAVHPFYQLIGVPGGAVLAALAISSAIALRPRALRPAAALAAAAFGALMAVNSVRYAQETARLPGAHGLTALSLEHGLALGAALNQLYTGAELVISPVEEWITASLAGRTFDHLQANSSAEGERAAAVLVVPPGGAVVVRAGYELDSLPVSPAASWRALLPDGAALALDRLTPDAVPRDGRALRGDDGIIPVSARLERAGSGWRVISAWQVTELLPPEASSWLFAPFAHVYNAQGERALVVDGAAVPGYQWRAGDLHLHQMAFALPPGTPAGRYTVVIGQYDAARARSAIFVTADGAYTPTVPAGALTHSGG